MPSSEEIKQQIKILEEKLHEANIREGKHDELVAEYGMTWASIRSHANKLGYKFRKNKPLKKKEVA